MELPEREYFKIEAVARRWKCSQDDVLHLIETNKLIPSFRFKSIACTKLITDGNKGWTEAAPLVSKGKIVPFRCSGLLIMCNSRQFWAKHYPITTEWEGELDGKMFRAPDDAAPFFKSFHVQVSESWKVIASDLLITLDEVLRFEAEHSTTAATPEPAPQKLSLPPQQKMSKVKFQKYTTDHTEQRRSEGVEDFDIAWELRNQGASFQRIGEIFDPGAPGLNPSAYTHKGKKFLGLK